MQANTNGQAKRLAVRVSVSPHEVRAPPWLEDLQAIGVRLFLDDFGAGFSGPGYLRRFPINRMKVGQSFADGAHWMPVHGSGGGGRGE